MADQPAIVVACPLCETELEAQPNHIGKTLPCPVCGESILVPKPEPKPKAPEKPKPDPAKLLVLWCSNLFCGGRFGAERPLTAERLQAMECPTCGSPLGLEAPTRAKPEETPDQFADFLDEEIEAEAEARRREAMAKPAEIEDPREKFARQLEYQIAEHCPKCGCRELKVYVAGSEGDGGPTGALIGTIVDGVTGGIGGALVGGLLGSSMDASVYEYQCQDCGFWWHSYS
jgi:predicted RNA-binding Zn-ribbon protein involved in translation (DUF1610 family)